MESSEELDEVVRQNNETKIDSIQTARKFRNEQTATGRKKFTSIPFNDVFISIYLPSLVLNHSAVKSSAWLSIYSESLDCMKAESKAFVPTNEL